MVNLVIPLWKRRTCFFFFCSPRFFIEFLSLCTLLFNSAFIQYSLIDLIILIWALEALNIFFKFSLIIINNWRNYTHFFEPYKHTMQKRYCGYACENELFCLQNSKCELAVSIHFQRKISLLCFQLNMRDLSNLKECIILNTKYNYLPLYFSISSINVFQFKIHVYLSLVSLNNSVNW